MPKSSFRTKIMRSISGKALWLVVALLPTAHANADAVYEYANHNEYVEATRASSYLGHDGKTLLVATYAYTYTFKSTRDITEDLNAIHNPDAVWRPYLSDIYADANQASFTANLVICFGHDNGRPSPAERLTLLNAGFKPDGEYILCKNSPMVGTRAPFLSDAALGALAKQNDMASFSIGGPASDSLTVHVPDTTMGKAAKVVKAPFKKAGEFIGHAIAPFGLMMCKGSCGLPGG